MQGIVCEGDDWGTEGPTRGWNEEVESNVGTMTGMKRFEIGEAAAVGGYWRVMIVVKRIKTLEK